VVLSASHLTAAQASHTHLAAHVSDFATAVKAASPVWSVNGQTGDVVVVAVQVAGGTTLTTLNYGGVASVNGKTGTVTLTYADLSAAAVTHSHSTSDIQGFSDAASKASPVQSVNGKLGVVILGPGDVGAVGPTHTHQVASISGFSAAVAQYSPVKSVNGQTGNVTLSGLGVASVNAKTGEVTLSHVDVTASPVVHTHLTSSIVGFTPAVEAIAAAAAPVKSVNGQTGSVTISYPSISAAAASHTHDASSISGLAAAVAANCLVRSVNGKTGDVVIASLDGNGATTLSYGGVASINGKTGTVTIRHYDVGAPPITHTHAAMSIVGITSAITNYSPVKKVNGYTGLVVLVAEDVTAASQQHTHIPTECLPPLEDSRVLYTDGTEVAWTTITNAMTPAERLALVKDVLVSGENIGFDYNEVAGKIAINAAASGEGGGGGGGVNVQTLSTHKFLAFDGPLWNFFTVNTVGQNVPNPVNVRLQQSGGGVSKFIRNEGFLTIDVISLEQTNNCETCTPLIQSLGFFQGGWFVSLGSGKWKFVPSGT
jgi:hypothetical protein